MLFRSIPLANVFLPDHYLKHSGEERNRILLVANAMLSLVLLQGMFLIQNLTSIDTTYAAANSTFSSAIPAIAGSSVTTYKGNKYRTGNYSAETILNTSNVNAAQFGKRVTYPVNGQVYAQPLFVPHLLVNGAIHNVVFVATEHDSVYAFDADSTTAISPLWSTSFLTSGATPVLASDVSCDDVSPEIGITSTPVIVTSSNTLYVVAFTKENGSLIYRLHAIDITTGHEKPGSPIVIQGNSGGIAFDPSHERQRGALLAVNGQVYVSFGAFCDLPPDYGWIISYRYSSSNALFQQTAIYNDTVIGGGGGIWGAGGGLASDGSGNIYTVTSNGTFNLNTGGPSTGDTVLKLTPQLNVIDYFTPFNQLCLAQGDIDLGSGGPLLLPGINEQIVAGKEGRIYVVNNLNMGKFTPDPTLDCSSTEQNRTDIDHVLQEFPPQTIGNYFDGNNFSTPADWNSRVYFGGVNDYIKAYRLNDRLLSPTPISQTPETFGFPGGNPVISSNGVRSGTGVLWVIDPHAVLCAYDATNLANELYNSNINASRDALDSYVKFTVPTVGNGKVFVGTQTSLAIYGLFATRQSGV